MLRFLAVFAACLPLLLSAARPAQICGWFAYVPLDESALAAWDLAGTATLFLPVALALLALWLPARFPPVGAVATALVLVVAVAVPVAFPFPGPCGGPSPWELWAGAGCFAAALVALVLAWRRERGQVSETVARVRAVAWTVALAAVAWPLVSRLDVRPSLATAVPGLRDVIEDQPAVLQWLCSSEALGVWLCLAALASAARGRVSLVLGLALLVPCLLFPFVGYAMAVAGVLVAELRAVRRLPGLVARIPRHWGALGLVVLAVFLVMTYFLP
ncbi:hypothetical protein HII36_32135 [Nonomuraea sp. NN258]|uniref:hypothetical protein n=1 Tax=Nonomuraea antri TaxID=2730852 RepID=UPI001568CE20|nr:hypothetical protein [Nonomuraea antri]NRQ36448.1 hypothetical protein [Nonomuraea antri]